MSIENPSLQSQAAVVETKILSSIFPSLKRIQRTKFKSTPPPPDPSGGDGTYIPITSQTQTATVEEKVLPIPSNNYLVLHEPDHPPHSNHNTTNGETASSSTQTEMSYDHESIPERTQRRNTSPLETEV